MEAVSAPKKRGRPKKATTNAEPDLVKDSPRRTKSTKAAPTKAAKKASTTVKKTAVKPIQSKVAPTNTVKSANTIGSAVVQALSKDELNNSEILQKVVALEKSTQSEQTETKATAVSESFELPPANKPTMPAPLNDSQSPPALPATTYSEALPTKISPKSINAFAVNTLSAQAHPSRPPPKAGAGQLPKNYNSVARRITLALVAAPIALVTSWVLYERCEF